MGVVISERNVACEISEWMVTQLFGGERAESSNQPYWDVVNGDIKTQVKGHAKGDKNNTRYTEIDYSEDADITEIIIIVFSKDLQIKEFYKAPWKEIQIFIRKENKKPVIYWDDLLKYKLNIDELPNQEIVNIFK